MKEEQKEKLIVALQLAIILIYVFYAVRWEAESNTKVKVKAQKKLIRKAGKRAVKEMKKKNG